MHSLRNTTHLSLSDRNEWQGWALKETQRRRQMEQQLLEADLARAAAERTHTAQMAALQAQVQDMRNQLTTLGNFLAGSQSVKFPDNMIYVEGNYVPLDVAGLPNGGCSGCFWPRPPGSTPSNEPQQHIPPPAAGQHHEAAGVHQRASTIDHDASNPVGGGAHPENRANTTPGVSVPPGRGQRLLAPKPTQPAGQAQPPSRRPPRGNQDHAWLAMEKLDSVADVWEIYARGRHVRPGIRELTEKYGTSWRSCNESIRKRLERMAPIIQRIIELAAKTHSSIEAAIEEMDGERMALKMGWSTYSSRLKHQQGARVASETAGGTHPAHS